MGLSSNILWHQTNEKGFYEILESKKLRFSNCLERIIPEFKLEPIAFPMISVSEYPLSEIGNIGRIGVVSGIGVYCWTGCCSREPVGSELCGGV